MAFMMKLQKSKNSSFPLRCVFGLSVAGRVLSHPLPRNSVKRRCKLRIQVKIHDTAQSCWSVIQIVVFSVFLSLVFCDHIGRSWSECLWPILHSIQPLVLTVLSWAHNQAGCRVPLFDAKNCSENDAWQAYSGRAKDIIESVPVPRSAFFDVSLFSTFFWRKNLCLSHRFKSCF